jgi:hypothetical protein
MDIGTAPPVLRRVAAIQGIPVRGIMLSAITSGLSPAVHPALPGATRLELAFRGDLVTNNTARISALRSLAFRESATSYPGESFVANQASATAHPRLTSKIPDRRVSHSI